MSVKQFLDDLFPQHPCDCGRCKRLRGQPATKKREGKCSCGVAHCMPSASVEYTTLKELRLVTVVATSFYGGDMSTHVHLLHESVVERYVSEEIEGQHDEDLPYILEVIRVQAPKHIGSPETSEGVQLQVTWGEPDVAYKKPDITKS
jgi:hypothetical protein